MAHLKLKCICSEQAKRNHIFKTIFPMFVFASIFLWARPISWRKRYRGKFGQKLGELAMPSGTNELFKRNLDWEDGVENRFEAAIREAGKAIPANFGSTQF